MGFDGPEGLGSGMRFMYRRWLLGKGSRLRAHGGYCYFPFCERY